MTFGFCPARRRSVSAGRNKDNMTIVLFSLPRSTEWLVLRPWRLKRKQWLHRRFGRLRRAGHLRGRGSPAKFTEPWAAPQRPTTPPSRARRPRFGPWVQGRACYVEAVAGTEPHDRGRSGNCNGAAEWREFWWCGVGKKGTMGASWGKQRVCSQTSICAGEGLEWSGHGGWSEPLGDLIWASPEGSWKGDQEEKAKQEDDTVRHSRVVRLLTGTGRHHFFIGTATGRMHPIYSRIGEHAILKL
jgi:hypothetical protein